MTVLAPYLRTGVEVLTSRVVGGGGRARSESLRLRTGRTPEDVGFIAGEGRLRLAREVGGGRSQWPVATAVVPRTDAHRGSRCRVRRVHADTLVAGDVRGTERRTVTSWLRSLTLRLQL